MTKPEQGENGRWECFAYAEDPNEVIGALENVGVPKRPVEGEDGMIGFQISKAESNKLEDQGAKYEGDSPTEETTSTPGSEPPQPKKKRKRRTKAEMEAARAEAAAKKSSAVTEGLQAGTHRVVPEVAPTDEVSKPEVQEVVPEPLGRYKDNPPREVKESQELQEPGRVHHRTSPSTLQAREACSHYEPSGAESDAARAGTRQHNAVELRSTDSLPTDEEAYAVDKCIQFALSVEDEFRKAAEANSDKYIHLNEAYVHVDDDDTSAGYFDEAFIYADKAALIDWKFGQWEVEPAENNLQGFAYACGLFRQYPQVNYVTVYFVAPYLDMIESATFSREQQKDMLLRIKTVVKRSLAKEGKPTPSFLACYGCKNLASCSAVAEIALKASSKFSPLNVPKDFDPMNVADPEEAVKGYQLATIMSRWVNAFKSRVTNLAVEDEHFLPPGYKVIASADRRITDNRKAYQTLVPVLGEAKLWDMIKFGITAIENAVKENAPNGQKTAQAREVVEMLEAKNLLDIGEQKVYLRAITGAKDVTE